MRWRPSIRTLVLGVNVFVFLVPLLAIVLLRIYDTHLIQQTERRLIAESVLVAEIWRDRWLEEQGIDLVRAPSPRPPQAAGSRFYPIEPILDLTQGTLPARTSPPTRFATDRSGSEWAAGRKVIALLERAQLVNLSGVRILDTSGCVVASTGGDLGACVENLPEIAGALDGHYTAVARERISDEPPPPLTSISRRGKVRISVANPVFSAGELIGVVRVVRTAMDPLESLWLHRQTLLLGLVACLMLTLAFSSFFSYAISRPVRAITAAAKAIARSEKRRPFEAGIAPDELHQLSEALDAMTVQLTERAAYVSEFAANVSHEFKTPLTGIRGAAELLRESWRDMDDAQRARFIENIDADAAHLERLATRLLLLARIQNAPQATEAVRVVPFFGQLVARYGDAIRLATDKAPASIVINPDHLESAVRNLLDNALRHSAGQPVDVTVADADGRLSVAVRDRGPGISEANRHRIFERFFTTERDRGGTGLGLAIVKAVATARGGDVTFTTGPGGTTFTLTV